MPPPNATPRVRIRGMILTAGIAAITIMGTMLGAGLKTERDTKEVTYREDRLHFLGGSGTRVGACRVKTNSLYRKAR